MAPYLDHNSLGDESVKAITDNGIPSVHYLWLSFNHISAAGLDYFVKGEWTNLMKLHLAANHFGAEGAKILASKKWAML